MLKNQHLLILIKFKEISLFLFLNSRTNSKMTLDSPPSSSQAKIWNSRLRIYDTCRCDVT